MAHRIITQVVVTGARVFGRAFAEAWKQANATSRHTAAGRASSASSSGGSNTFASSGLTLDEACKILNVAPPKRGVAVEAVEKELEHVTERFKKLFDINDPQKGGSFYLQSKVLRARERIEMELKEGLEVQAAKKDSEKGWSPKVYKDR